ncbi:MAG TPA: hypothetical protein VKT30_15430 [Caulobacteraceae bacterium]|nr:hypothetical protein [Caulobacteraceae bacterium]
MSDAEDKLAAYFAESRAPSRDMVFELTVAQAIARRRLMIDAAQYAAGGVIVAALAAAAGPSLLAGAPQLLATMNAAGPALAVVAALGAALVWLGRRGEEEA